MKRLGYLTLTLRSGVNTAAIPCHLDCLSGATRAANIIDGGTLDHLLNQRGNGFRAACVFHARASLGRTGEQHVKYNDLEESLGLSRTYSIEIGEKAATEQVVKALQDLEKVESVHVETLATAPFEQIQTTPNRFTKRDAYEPHERIHVPEALALESGDERVTVAVVDTGIAMGHPEFQRKLLAGYDTVNLGLGRVTTHVSLVGDSRGRDFSPRDETGHGSHVAGILGAQGWRLPRGVAGRALILPIRVLAAARIAEQTKVMGVGGMSDIDAGLKVAIDLGADVVNMSFGTPESSVTADRPRPHDTIIRYALEQGAILVAAAGNSGIEERYYPAALDGVITVGSVDRNNRRSRFSTYGRHVTLCAPGEQIISTGQHGYMSSSGTSHAAPFVTGVAALLVSRARKAGRELKARDVERILTESVTPLSTEGYSTEFGYGLLNALAALQHLDQLLASPMPLGEKRNG